MNSLSPPEAIAALSQVLAEHWGYHSFRPLQQEAMQALLAGRDSLVVLPTGGGKSLCYQAPAVIRRKHGHGPTVVISPLISLMKDQVDALRANGVPAVYINSALGEDERTEVFRAIRQGQVGLVYCSPERLAAPGFRDYLQSLNVNCFVVDEAHCISSWGHDFRPEYRQLTTLKEQFPNASLHAFTATATEYVQRDIVSQLNLCEPHLLIGGFDRPNLIYRVYPREDLLAQVSALIADHKNEAGIIYCLRKKDVDALAAALHKRGVSVMPYHAGLSLKARHKAQEAFLREECDVIVATIAFGMGIDRSNVRYVIHANMPKSIEAYQQETGRAGRDGLAADCVLLYGNEDPVVWQQIITGSIQEAQDSGVCVDPEYQRVSTQHLRDMEQYTVGMTCRHKALVEYFDQAYSSANCGACDICLGDTTALDPAEAQKIAQMILSCIARLDFPYGAGYVVSVLRGENLERIRERRHEELSTYGLMRTYPAPHIREWITQLLAHNVLQREIKTSGERSFPVLRLNAASWEVMRGQRAVALKQPLRSQVHTLPTTAGAKEDWQGVERGLFEHLRQLRKQWATDKNVPTYVVFSDNTLRDLARQRPANIATLHNVYGIGNAKVAQYGEALLEAIGAYCREQGLTQNQAPATPVNPPPRGDARPARRVSTTTVRAEAARLFAQGQQVEVVAAKLERAVSTVRGYLREWIAETGPADITPWVTPVTQARILSAARQLGTQRLAAIHEALKGAVSYDEIGIVMAHERGRAG
jgi:ATP-dependent DNA helicase RecQ